MALANEKQLQEYADRKLLVCQECEYFGGVAVPQPRLRVHCRQCRVCGPKQISPAYQGCPAGRFESGLRAAKMEAKKVTVINLSQLPPLETLEGDALWDDHRVQFCARCAHCIRATKTCGQTGKKVWDAVNESCPLDRFRVHKGGFTGMVDGRGVGPRHPNYVAPRGPGQVPGKQDLTVTGAAEIGPMTPEVRRGYFDRVAVINLANRPERLAAFRAMLAAAEWPFREPEVVSVRHGDALGVPPWWRAGGGAWGCMLSHRRVLEDALRDDVRNLLVMEDDCLFQPAAKDQVADFLQHVPRDWQQIMFGGQLFGDSRQVVVNERVRRVSQCERTHCYALNREAMQSLWFWWQRPGNGGHCDHQMGDWQDTGIRVYAPTEFLAAQAEARSDITGKQEPVRWWNGNRAALVAAAPAVDRMPIEGGPRIWWHIACMGETWRIVVREQAELLRRCLGTEGGKLAVGVGILGTDADREEAEKMILAAGLLPEPLYESENLLEYEIPTMQMMWETAQASRPGDGDEQYIYLHTKGVSTGDESKRAWRKIMEMFVVEKWAKCREGLAKADVAGIGWRGDPGEQYPHLAGNFWVARSSYLRRLASPVDYSKSRGGSYLGSPWARMSAEMWLGTGKPAVCEIWRPEGGRLDQTSLRDWEKLKPRVAAAFPMPPKAELDALYGPETKHFVHSGKIGDLIYALPAIRASGGGVIWMDDWESKTGLRVTPELVEQQIRPLLMAGAADYVRDVRFCESRPRQFEIDLNKFREQETGNIVYDHLKLLGFSYDLANKEWMSFAAEIPSPADASSGRKKVVFCRSKRYHNPEFDWAAIHAKYAADAIFIGLREEHEDFERDVGPVCFLPTETLLDAAKIIAGADLVVSNKSALCAIATSIGVSQIVEMDRPDAMLPSAKMCLGDNRPIGMFFNEITAVIRCKGRLSRLKACVWAARMCGFRVIVVDVECPDGAGEWVNGLGDAYVRCVHYKGVFSHSATKNRGIREVVTPYTMVLDADVILWPREFAYQLRQSGWSDQHFLHRRDPGLEGWVIFPTGAAFFDEDFKGYGCDDDAFLFGLERAGIRAVKIDGPFAHHIGHSDQDRMMSMQGSKEENMRDNMAILRRKFGSSCWPGR